MVDDGKEHGDDRRADDERDSRHYELRRQPSIWMLANGSLAKFAGAVAGAVFLVGLAMQLLGFRFTGAGADIKANTKDISHLQSVASANAAAIAANTQAIAATVATNVTQARDIVEVQGAIKSLLFMQCAMYRKMYEGAPTISECVRKDIGL